MAASWQEIHTQLNGYFVAGQLIVRVNKKHTIVGRRFGEVFVFTPAGKKLSEEFIPARVTPASLPPSPPVRRGRPRKKVLKDAEATDTKL